MSTTTTHLTAGRRLVVTSAPRDDRYRWEPQTVATGRVVRPWSAATERDIMGVAAAVGVLVTEGTDIE